MNRPSGGERARSLRRQIERLSGLPLRPATARAFLEGKHDEPQSLDPSWELGRALGRDPAEMVAGQPWWVASSNAAALTLDRLWRHAAATSLAARKLAEEVHDPTAERLGRVGLLHALGHWVAAATDLDGLCAILDVTDLAARRALERERFGVELSLLGKALAERWEVDPLLIEATWLLDLPAAAGDACSADPRRLRILRRARNWADRTPWSLGPTTVAPPHDPARQWVMVEVQTHCRGPFVAADATPAEESLVRRCAGLERENERLRKERDQAHEAIEGLVGPSEEKGLKGRDLFQRVRRTWDRGKAEEKKRTRELETLTSAFLDESERQVQETRKARQEGLAEFAAGAGHELNNPLAVILGRAQLLLARQPDGETVQSLKIVVAQARRAHRILRDLMYVARPPEPRPRPCEPDLILRNCVGDLQAEAESRGVRLSYRTREPSPLVRADSEGLRHLAEVLVRNALEATPHGGEVQVTADSAAGRLEWSITDAGRGIGEVEAERVFDPFYCGRQAGRGLGLGLPRAARFVAQCGGTIRWRSHPGHGTTFHVALPAERVLPPEKEVVTIHPREE